MVTNITKVWKTANGLPHLPRYHNDCAVFRVQDPFVFSPRVRPIQLPSAFSPVTDGAVATVAGWGAAAEKGANSKHLKAVQVPIVGLSECRRMNAYVRENNVCAGYGQGGKTFCDVSGSLFLLHKRDCCVILMGFQSDLGGPLVAGGVLIGIAAADYYCGTRPGEYGIYTRISHYVNFISEVEMLKFM